MSLRKKIVLILVAVVSVYAATDHFLQRATVWPSFLAVERDEAREDVERVCGAIVARIEDLNRACQNWAAWDDTYAFVENGNAAYVASNLGPTSFADRDVDLLYICDADGQVVWGDIRGADGRSIQLHDFPRSALSTRHPLIVASAGELSVASRDEGVTTVQLENRGILLTERGPLLVSASPVTKSDGTGEPRGTVIFGRFLAADLEQELTAQTKVRFDFWPLDPPDALPEAEREVLASVGPAVRPVLVDANDDLLYAYTAFNDIQRKPALLIRANVARDISMAGGTALSYAARSTIAAALVILLVQIALIQRTVLSPLFRLTAHAVAIGKTDDVHARIDLERTDEVGVLSREFDNMMEKLAVSRAQVIDAARSAGMSEIATGILHNVGNVLNSVNVTASMLDQRVQKMGIADLEQVSEVLEQHAADLGAFVTDNPQGKHLQPFLKTLSGHLSKEQEGVLEEIGSLTNGIEHIRELITSQQSYAKKGGLSDSTFIEELIDKALDIGRQATSGGADIQIEKSIEDLPRVLVDPHRTMEILVNLVQNAKHALRDKRDDKRIDVRALKVGDQLRIEVQDNGVGIAADNLERVFNHGFTTKKDGHGFGLHTAANAATEMGGHLRVESDGEGLGACFVLEIPFRAAATVEEVA